MLKNAENKKKQICGIKYLRKMWKKIKKKTVEKKNAEN